MKIQELLEILNKPSSITADDILQFTNVTVTNNKVGGGFSVKQSDWNLHSTIVLNKGDVVNLDETVTTTIGRAIANRVLKVDPFGSFFKYDNNPIDINDFIDHCTIYLMSGDITTEQMGKLFNHSIWLTRFADMILPSLSQKILVTPKSAIELRKKLIADNQDVIAAGSIDYVKNVEKPVLKEIIDQVKDDPSFALYTMGKPDVNNHLKQSIGTFSPILNPETGKFEFPKGNLMTGLSSENYNLLANMNINGSYNKAVSTQNGGAIVKSLYGSLHTITAAPRGTDCKSTVYKKVLLNSDTKKLYMWNYMVEGRKLVLLTPKNYKQYEGKTCYFRSALFCKYENSQQICNICCGEIPYRINLLSIGSMSSKVGFNFVKLSLKIMHDSTVSVGEIDPFEYMHT